MADLRLLGSTSNIVRFTLKNNTNGQGKTGLSTATSGLIISTICDNESSPVAYSGSNLQTIATLGTFAAPASGKCRFKEVSAVNHPGLYEFQFEDVRFSVSNSKRLIVSVNDGENAILDSDYEVQLVKFDPYDGIHLGLSSLPNASATAANGLPTLGTGSGQINPASGKVPATMGSSDYSGNTVQTGDTYALANGSSGFVATKTSISTLQTTANNIIVNVGSPQQVGTKYAVSLNASDVTGNLPGDLQTIKTQAVACAGPVTVPSATLASTTNITGGVITTVTNLTNLPSIPSNWLTASGIAAAALNGKGDWLTASGYTAPLSAAGTRSALGMASANLDTQLASISAAIPSLTAIFTTALTESYATNGATATLAQLLYMIYSTVMSFSIGGTTISMKQLDGSSIWGTAALTLNADNQPIARVRNT